MSPFSMHFAFFFFILYHHHRLLLSCISPQHLSFSFPFPPICPLSHPPFLPSFTHALPPLFYLHPPLFPLPPHPRQQQVNRYAFVYSPGEWDFGRHSSSIPARGEGEAKEEREKRERKEREREREECTVGEEG